MERQGDTFHWCLKAQPDSGTIAPAQGWVASSAVEHPAFNRLVLSSNLRRPISPTDIEQAMIGWKGRW